MSETECGCWCGIDHAYMDFDYDGNPYDIRDFEDDEDDA